MANAHVGESGVQGWSCGEIYPYSVVVVDGGESGYYCQAFHAITGVKLSRYYYAPGPNNFGTFSRAHKAAESEAKGMLRREQRIVGKIDTVAAAA